MKKIFVAFALISISIFVNAQQKTVSNKKVLFIGNSYTYVNNLPQMVSDVSASAGDTITFNSSAPGGATFNNHTQNTTTTSLIMGGNWDYVVLQEQSQYPSFPIEQVATESFPYARSLDSLINVYNPCAETVFYMTWGRKNGDASNCAEWPPVCTYLGMDSLLRLRYTMMAENNNAILSPVSALWRFLIVNNPSLELYSSDESHPSVAGTYAASCSFYTVLFRKDPTSITFTSSLSATDAEIIRNAAKAVVYDSLPFWFVGKYHPDADFSFNADGTQASFTNTSLNSDSYAWDFGDGSTSTDLSPVHNYASPGTFDVTLIVSRCELSDTITKQITIIPQTISELAKPDFELYPNPANNCIHIRPNGDFGFGKYTIINQYGQEVLSGFLEIGKSEKKINLNELRAGVYSIIFTDLDKQNYIVRRIVKLN
jgi:hypothetical protein